MNLLMTFHWLSLILVIFYILQIGFSVAERTFLGRQNPDLDLPLVWHWGVLIGDPILIVFYCGIASYMKIGLQSIIFMLLSFIITQLLHESWWNIRGHIFPNHDKSRDMLCAPEDEAKMFWYHDLSNGGICHFVFFFLMLVIIMEYIITPLPDDVVQSATFALFIFAPFGVFEPGWAEWQRKKQRDPNATWFWRSFISLLAMWAAILIIAWFKA